MAPTDSTYFPSLESCLYGENRLLSWSAALNALSSIDNAQYEWILERFLTDEDALKHLETPLDPFSHPSTETKSQFETLTAAINITPSHHGQFDIDQIKADTLWLSEKTKINEPAALRIVVLEWQNRPALQLLDASIGADGGDHTAPDFGSSKPLPQVSAGYSAVGAGNFSSNPRRQSRLLQSYLSEKSSLLRIAEILIRAQQYEDDVFGRYGEHTPLAKGKERARSDNWVSGLGSVIQENMHQPGMSLLTRCQSALERRLEDIETGSGYYGEELQPSVEETFGAETVKEIIYIMQMMSTFLEAVSVPDTIAIRAWYSLMIRYQFFNELQFATPAIQMLVRPLQSLTSLISLQILKIASMPHLLDNAAETCITTYLAEREAVKDINQALILAAERNVPNVASPAVFAWAIITDAWRAFTEYLNATDEVNLPIGLGSNNTRRILDSFEEVKNSPLDLDLIQFFANSATSVLQVHEVLPALAITLSKTFSARIDHSFNLQSRNALLALVVNSLSLVQYSEPVIVSILAILNGRDGYWDAVHPPARTATRAKTPVEILLGDEWTKDRLLVQAQSRYPLEIVPLMQFCQAICVNGLQDQDEMPTALRFIKNLSRYTQRLPHGVEPYSLVREDENQNFACLNTALPMFSRSRGQPNFGGALDGHDSQALVLMDATAGEEIFSLPAGTLGSILDDSSKPYIGCWEYSYPGLTHLALLLSTITSGSYRVDFATQAPVDRFQAAEIIGFLASALAVCARYDNVGGAHAVLEAASDGLDRTEDIITTVLTILDETLQTPVRDVEIEGTLDLLVKCMHFAYGVTKLLPQRIWPFLSRSSLLDLDCSGGNLVNIVTTELSLGRHDFLICSVRLFDALIEDSIASAVERRIPSKQITRFEEAKVGGSGTTEKAMEKIVTALTRIMTDIFQSASSWRFDDVNEKLEVDTVILRAFQKILEYVYGYDDAREPSKKITGLLALGAEHLLDTFLVPSGNDLALEPLLGFLAAGAAAPSTTLLSDTSSAWITRTIAGLGFVETLLRTGVLLDLKTPRLQSQLFEVCQLLARLYVAHDSFKVPTLTLLETMVLSAGRTDEEPPSLLGHLGPETSKCFLKVLSSLSKPLEDSTLELRIWRLLSAVVSNRQQWFAIFLLTGDAGRGSTRKEKNSAEKSHGRPLLQYALDQLADPQTFKNRRRAIAMLDFVALAQDNWPWAVLDVRKHTEFISTIPGILNNSDPPNLELNDQKDVRVCEENREAARIADILAMCLHEARQVGDISLAKDLSSKLYYYRDHAIKGADTAYNESLHVNMVRNFEMKYSISPKTFKRTALTATPGVFGDDYFYSLEHADKALGFDSSWSSRKGFRSEFEASNIMLSLVESHVILLNSWKNLAVELSQVLKEEPALQFHMAKVVKDCVSETTKSRLPTNIKDGFLQTRLDLAFTLTQKLVDAKSTEPDVRNLFSTVWGTIRDSTVDLETGLTGPDASYYRTILKILFLSLQPHLDATRYRPFTNETTSDKHTMSVLSNDAAQDVLDVLSDVICTSFRHLCTTLHASDSSNPNLNSAVAAPSSDLVTLMALLQTLLSIPDISTLYPQIYLRVTSSNLIRYATSLFSWSHQLISPASDNPDPIYGDLALLFLLALSSVPALAHQIAVDGVLAALSSAPLTQLFLRPRGCGPFDPPTRLYSIWYRGFLPLCLNLLRHVGAPIAAEVGGFLNQFPRQLERAARSIEARPTRGSPAAAKPTAQEKATASEGGAVRVVSGGDALQPLTLGLASELHSLALVALILARFRALGPATGVPADQLPTLDPRSFPVASVREEIETWLGGNRKALRERIVPVGEREARWARREAADPGGMCESRLEERVVGELESAVGCLREIGEV
ncbi:MAG: hypothetical protein Q9157_004124 [Trypethelium eluteriae]